MYSLKILFAWPGRVRRRVGFAVSSAARHAAFCVAFSRCASKCVDFVGLLIMKSERISGFGRHEKTDLFELLCYPRTLGPLPDKAKDYCQKYMDGRGIKSVYKAKFNPNNPDYAVGYSQSSVFSSSSQDLSFDSGFPVSRRPLSAGEQQAAQAVSSCAASLGARHGQAGHYLHRDRL